METKRLLPEVKENVSLAKYTTFKIGGPARYFYVAKTEKDLIKAIEAAKKCKLPFFILGGGSNLLVADKGFKGLVIHIKNQKSKIKNTYQKSKIIEYEAGVKLADLVKISLDNGLTGLEWAAGIPGTLGGAIYGNAGWPSGKKNISSVIEKVMVLEIGRELKIKDYKLKECKFEYRDSIFKHRDNLIILSACIKLKKGNKAKIKKDINGIIKKRKEKIPVGFSAGSVFKNPEKIPAGVLIEKCGLRGKRVGRAQISEKHANFIVNLGGARAKDVKKLIDLIKKKVENKFGITLKEEICYLGFPK